MRRQRARVEKDTDNLPFFRAALAAMAASGNRSAKLAADGHFCLSDTLVLTQTVVLEGTAMNEPPPFNFHASSRSTPGTMLVFPKNVTGIRIRSAAGLDNPTKSLGNAFGPSGEKTVLRNLTVYCKDGNTQIRYAEWTAFPRGDCIHGIHASAPARLENVIVQSFAHDGIHIVGATCGKDWVDKDGNSGRVYDGNADGSYVENCNVGGCGRDGKARATVHYPRATIDDTGLCVAPTEAFGNTYLGGYSEGNVGPNYIFTSALPRRAPH